MICGQGDIIQVNFDPHFGHEPSKYRPALVISSDGFNRRSALTVVCPITSTDNSYPMHVRIESEEVNGFVCLEAMHAIDLSARKCRNAGVASEEEMTEVLDLVGAVFGI